MTIPIPYFNPRSREGSDRNSAICDNSDSLFQSTLPRGERPGLAWFLFPFRAFQSTLPRGERPRSPRSMICAMISIHAPARGATQSQHRPTAERLDFNPRSREGSDDVLYYSGTVYNYISIHAPARGATATNIENGKYSGDFNPRSREGSDLLSSARY